MATILKRWLVALTAGLLKPRKLTWNGKIRKAPDTPPIEVKKEITKAIIGGIQGLISISAIGKYIKFRIRYDWIPCPCLAGQN
jgi:hypothetical protein